MTRSERQKASFVTLWHSITQPTKLLTKQPEREAPRACRSEPRRRNVRPADQMPSTLGKSPAAVSTVSNAQFRVYVQSSALAMLMHTNCKRELFVENCGVVERSDKGTKNRKEAAAVLI
jgi:hypothetical protein